MFSKYSYVADISRTPEIVSRDGSLTRGLKPPNGTGRLSIWLQESLSTLEQYQRDATVIEQNITKLSRLLQQIESSNIVIAEVRKWKYLLRLCTNKNVLTFFRVPVRLCRLTLKKIEGSLV